jgi:hypothetical protein
LETAAACSPWNGQEYPALCRTGWAGSRPASARGVGILPTWRIPQRSRHRCECSPMEDKVEDQARVEDNWVIGQLAPWIESLCRAAKRRSAIAGASPGQTARRTELPLNEQARKKHSFSPTTSPCLGPGLGACGAAPRVGFWMAPGEVP